MGERERRWIMLAADGAHASLGRHTDPKEEEIQAMADTVRNAGLQGWLAIMEGVYYSSETVTLLAVRTIVPGEITWDSAAAAFHRRRKDLQDFM